MPEIGFERKEGMKGGREREEGRKVEKLCASVNQDPVKKQALYWLFRGNLLQV